MPASQSQPRRSYHRYPAEVWNNHRSTIRELYIVQGKEYEEVAAVLRAEHGLDIGVRQLKRWIAKRGFFRNIPDSDMRKMVRKRQKRQRELGRPTRFFRRRRDADEGGLQEVPAAKLDAYQKRHSSALASPTSQFSGGMPSNIIYRTPTNYVPAPHPAASCSEADVSSQCGLSESALTRQALQDSLNGKYREALQKLRLIRLPSSTWKQALRRFDIDVIEAATYPGSPLSVAARVMDALSRALIREMQRYRNSRSDNKDQAELRRAQIALKKQAESWGILLMQHRVLQIWEPILGRDHPKLLYVRSSLARFRVVNRNPDFLKRLDTWDAAGPLAALIAGGRLPSPGTVCIADLVHLGDAPPNRLLEQLRAIEGPSAAGQQIRLKTELRLGRIRALMGVYYSSICLFAEAETAFRTSERYMGHETCVEIKLHRMLWYAEHKTRVGDWEGVRRLMQEAHEVFMANDDVSEFVLHHFPGRFGNLYTAVSTRMSIDKVSNLAPVPATPGPPGPPAATPGNLESASPQPLVPPAESSVLSPSRLFPFTPGAVNAAIDIDAWRQFVEYSPDQTAETGRVTCVD
ncbi:43665189-f139-4667-bec0-1efc654f4120 [Thermothielavioides terrestris]|uniref:Clr5 domain-containing protein n=2 Tax=Thermothielavioides terrestris TaxID=2587410 RepID=G2QZA4_THETT|nr:uncharacterized protein THITE_2115966 [Thermothielavioides terrestris NRRL 8126]AEO67137.1 hypothetical protein THITE_2115966 [Thermothielavioides terrestris NRRL 8126]SPQ23837.1 43665189-f139-4667-bec0-1efc654f4120 [Thermothielavioides terrestris]